MEPVTGFILIGKAATATATATAATATTAAQTTLAVKGSVSLCGSVFAWFWQVKAPAETVHAVTTAVATGATASAGYAIKNHIDRGNETHRHNLAQDAIERDRTRESDARVIQALRDGNCGQMSDQKKYIQFWDGVWARNPGDRVLHGKAFEKCIESSNR